MLGIRQLNRGKTRRTLEDFRFKIRVNIRVELKPFSRHVEHDFQKAVLQRLSLSWVVLLGLYST